VCTVAPPVRSYPHRVNRWAGQRLPRPNLGNRDLRGGSRFGAGRGRERRLGGDFQSSEGRFRGCGAASVVAPQGSFFYIGGRAFRRPSVDGPKAQGVVLDQTGTRARKPGLRGRNRPLLTGASPNYGASEHRPLFASPKSIQKLGLPALIGACRGRDGGESWRQALRAG